MHLLIRKKMGKNFFCSICSILVSLINIEMNDLVISGLYFNLYQKLHLHKSAALLFIVKKMVKKNLFRQFLTGFRGLEMVYGCECR